MGFNSVFKGLKTQRIHTSGTGKSTPSNTVPFSTAIFSSGVEWNTRQYLHCSSCYREKVNSSVLQKFSGRKITSVYRWCASGIMWTNVAMTWQSTSMFWQKG